MAPYFYDSFTRQQWARFDAGSYRLSPAALTLLKGVNEPMHISEVEEIIGPLCTLLPTLSAELLKSIGRFAPLASHFPPPDGTKTPSATV